MTTETDSPATPPPTVAIPPAITGVLQAFARRTLLLAWFGGLARLLLLFLGALLVRGFLDYWLQLSWAVRTAFLAADLGIAGWIVRRHLWLPWKNRLDTERAALRLQHAFPALGSHLIAAVQLPRQVTQGRASPELVSCVVAEAAAKASTLAWRSALPAGPVAKRWIPVVLCGALIAGAWVARPEAASLLMRRVWLSTEPAFSRTQLDVTPGDTAIPLGSSLTLVAQTSGDIPAEAVLELRSEEGDPRSFTLASDETAHGTFSLPIANIQQPFRYRVFAGDARSSWHSVDILIPPVLESLSITIQPPAYTGIPTSTASGDVLNIPSGSTLKLTGRAVDSIRSAEARLWQSTSDKLPSAITPLSLNPDRRNVSGDIQPLDSTRALSVSLESADGLRSSEDTRYRLQILPDQHPVVEFDSAPADGSLATSSEILRFAGRVADDYGVATLTLKWRVERDNQVVNLGESPVALSTDLPRQTPFSVSLPLSSIADAGSTLIWWFESTDQNPSATQPEPATSSVKIVTNEQKVADTLNKVRSRSTLLDEISRAQDALSESLGKSIESSEKP